MGRTVRPGRVAVTLAGVLVLVLQVGGVAVAQTVAPGSGAPVAGGSAAPQRAPLVAGSHAGAAGATRAVSHPARGVAAVRAPAWPAGGSAMVAVASASIGGETAAGTVPAAGPSSGSADAASASVAGWTQAGALPVAVSAAPAAGEGTGSAAGTVPVSKVLVTVASHAGSVAAGSDGVVLSVARADGGSGPGRVRVRLGYSGFGSGGGGGFGSRLTLVAMPACALTTPKVAACQKMSPVAGVVNDPSAGTLTATVSVPGGGAGLVLAAQSSTSGGTGDFTATSLTASSQWQAGTQTGGFSWSYPLGVPPPVAGSAPSLALGYDSSATDGETAQGDSQPGQAGEGFSLAGAGFIQRQYQSCGALIAGTVSGSANNTNESSPTGDQCWDGYNAYLSMAGLSGQLIYDPVQKTWRVQGDDGSVVRLIQGGTSNGAYNNTHWEIVTPDGTQYWFGLNELPGYQAGDRVTNSVLTVPVVGLGTNDPCHSSSYASSYCANMAWRWNLDLVVDSNGNATSYYYNPPETSYYAFQSTSSGLGSKWLSYDTTDTLADVYYGGQDVSAGNPAGGGNVYAHRPFDVHFSYADRCTLFGDTGSSGLLSASALQAEYANASDKSTCDTQAAHLNATYWPDTPWDLHCPSGPCTGSQHESPAFYDTQMLVGVQSSVYEGSSTYQPVDTWTLGYSFQPSDVNDDLTLTAIYRTGENESGGTMTLPPVTLGWTALANRVWTYGDTGFPQMLRYRMTSVVSEAGATTSVTYNTTGGGTTGSCAPNTPPTVSSNTYPCFPQPWTQSGQLGSAGPTETSWFFKYTVAQVRVHDVTGGEPDLVTSYVYCPPASPQCQSNATGQGVGWHYDTDIDLVPAKDKSYAQYRGYQYVHVIRGAAGGTQSETDYTFLRGESGDPVKNSAGAWTYPPVTVQPADVAGTKQAASSVTDDNALNGLQLEAIAYDGLDTGPVVSDQVSWPWESAATATSATQPWGKPLYAVHVNTAETDTYTPLSPRAGGGTRQVQETYTYDTSVTDGQTGVLESSANYGDLAVPAQELCTAYSYPAAASPQGLTGYPVEVQTTACGTAGSPLVSDVKSSYDGQAWGAAPAAGNVTETDTAQTASHTVKTYATYDSYGRVTSATDGDGNCTSYGYASAWGTGNATTTTAVYAPLGTPGAGCTTAGAPAGAVFVPATKYATTSTDLYPERGEPKDSHDASGQVTSYVYDPLGRLSCVWLPGQAGSTSSCAGTPNYAYAYSLTPTAAPYVQATKLLPQGYTQVSYQIYDSLLRARQSQAPAEGGGTVVTDTFYDSRGNTAATWGPYPTAGAASGSLFQTTQGSDAQIPTETRDSYDGAGRLTASDLYSDGTLQWGTATAYSGSDAVTVTPPAGGTITTTYTDGRGRTAEIDQYHSQTTASGPYDATSYGYDPAGDLTGITDAAGNTWSYGYDLAGEQVTAATPDTGTSATSYDDDGNMTAVTTAGHTITTSYDAAGRPAASYDTTGGAQPVKADQLTAFTYDTAALDNPNTTQGASPVAVGQLASATSYVGGATSGEAYTETAGTYNPQYQPEKTTYTIPNAGPAAGTGLAGSYEFDGTYNTDGSQATATYPATGPLPAETLYHYYDSTAGLPSATTSCPPAGCSTTASTIESGYAQATTWNYAGQPTQVKLADGATGALASQQSNTWDPATGRLTSTQVQAQQQNGTWAAASDTSYGYDQSGDLTSAADSVTGDNQCLSYDYLSRLTAAWTQPAAACSATAPPATQADIGGGPAPYEQALTYDTTGTNAVTTGQVTSDTLTTLTGTTPTTTATAYTYPGYGQPRPHAPANATTTTNNVPQPAVTSTWTGAGQLASTTPAAGTPTTYTWNAPGMTPGQLAAITTPATTTSYRYDTAGDQILVADTTTTGTTTTLNLPGEQLTATTPPGGPATLTATRYYDHAGQQIAARTATCPAATCTTSNGTLSWLFANPQGTATTAINPATQTVTQRYYTPYGQPRGTTPPAGTFPGTQGYIGGTTDTTTGLTDLGARQYSPANPGFISPDPILAPYQPTDLNPYDYAGNNPATNTDPTGLDWLPTGDGATGGSSQEGPFDDPNSGADSGSGAGDGRMGGPGSDGTDGHGDTNADPGAETSVGNVSDGSDGGEAENDSADLGDEYRNTDTKGDGGDEGSGWNDTGTTPIGDPGPRLTGPFKNEGAGPGGGSECAVCDGTPPDGFTCNTCGAGRDDPPPYGEKGDPLRQPGWHVIKENPGLWSTRIARTAAVGGILQQLGANICPTIFGKVSTATWECQTISAGIAAFAGNWASGGTEAMRSASSLGAVLAGLIIGAIFAGVRKSHTP